MTASFCSVSPAVIAQIVHLSCRLAKLGMDDWLQWVIAAGCCHVTIWREAEEAVLLIGRYSRHPLLRLVVSPRQHADFAARRRPLGHQHRKGVGYPPPTVSRSCSVWRVSSPLLVAATAVIGLIVFPILQPTWVLCNSEDGTRKRESERRLMRIVVEIPEPYGRTERHARGYVVSALAAVDNTRTRHDARVYWGERVKSFDRVYTAVVERPQNVQLVKYLADALQAVASGHPSTAITYLQRVLKMLDEKVDG